jgi:hypothetical protein
VAGDADMDHPARPVFHEEEGERVRWRYDGWLAE